MSLCSNDERGEIVKIGAAAVFVAADLWLDIKRTVAHDDAPIAGGGDVNERAWKDGDLHNQLRVMAAPVKSTVKVSAFAIVIDEP